MSRPVRLAVLAAVVGSGALTPLVLPARAASDVPSNGCFQVVDRVGDASDPDLDLVGVAFKTTSTSLRAYVRANALRSSPQRGDAHRFAVAFTYRGVRFTAAASASAHGTDQLRDNPAAGRTVGAATQLYVDSTLLPAVSSDVTAVFDQRNSLVVLDVPVRDITRYAGSPWGSGAGALLTDVVATSAVDLVAGTLQTDTTGSSNATYAVGDNRCFGPPPAVLSFLSAAQSQYGDLARVTVRLTDESGRALSGRSVRVDLAGSSTSATTGSDGTARVALSPGVVAGTYPLTASFGGDTVAGGTAVTRSYVVIPETTVLGLSTRTKRGDRTVTATLKDDDGTPLSGASVTFRYGSTTTTLVTSVKGVAELHDVAAGSEVTASYAGVSGTWLGSSATTRATGRGNDDD